MIQNFLLDNYLSNRLRNIARKLFYWTYQKTKNDINIQKRIFEFFRLPFKFLRLPWLSSDISLISFWVEVIFGGNDIGDFLEDPIPGRSRIIQKRRLLYKILNFSIFSLSSSINLKVPSVGWISRRKFLFALSGLFVSFEIREIWTKFPCVMMNAGALNKLF